MIALSFIISHLAFSSVAAQTVEPAPMDSIRILEQKVDSMLAGDTLRISMPDEGEAIIAADTVKLKIWRPDLVTDAASGQISTSGKDMEIQVTLRVLDAVSQ